MIVFVTRPIPEQGLAVLRQADVEVRVRKEERPIPRAELLEGVRGARGLLCMLTDRVDGGVLDAGPLAVVANMAVGTDNLDLAAARARGVVVTNTPGVLTDATADLAMALLLAAARRIVEGDLMVRRGDFVGWGPLVMVGADLAGQTLGIVGPGRIGAAVAHRARAFGMEVVVAARSEHPEVGPRLPLDELLRVSDVVSLHCPLTSATHHLLDARRLALMKPEAILINTARGPVVDEGALVAALASGRLGAAGLDVYEGEPAVHPGLLALPNVVLAPHSGSATRRTRGTMAAMAAADLVAVLTGRAPRHPVV
ncbi:MAG: D-glycerate dehydrogenase [Pseudomonadota bacterium]